MEINEETYGLFDRYFMGELSAKERKDFEKTLSPDDQFREEFQWFDLAVSEIRMKGRSILKKQLAEIGAAIPASAFEKYSPSIKPKGFFKKWWWAIAVVAVGLAAAWFVWQHRTPAVEGKKDGMTEFPDVLKNDLVKPNADSVLSSPFNAPVNSNERDSVFDEHALQYVPCEDCRTFSIRASSQVPSRLYETEMSDAVKGQLRNDTSFVLSYSDLSYTTASETILTVECCPQNSMPAFYTYANRIILSASYADTSGLRFFQHGNEVMMTDSKPGFFILEKGSTEKPLVRNHAAAGKKTKSSSIKSDMQKW